jgi:hypothetical protein
MASAAMLLSDGLRLIDEGRAVIAAIERTLVAGHRTADIAEAGSHVVGTRAFADATVAALTSS